MKHLRTIKSKKIILFIFCFISNLMIGQEYKKLTYGGLNGKSHNASFEVHYFLAHEGRKEYIDNSVQVIDLNDYKSKVRLGVQLKNLKVGLNNSFSKIRNQNHAKVFYVEGFSISNTNEAFRSVGLDTIKKGSKSNHFSTGIDFLVFEINPLHEKTKLDFKINTLVVDAVYNRKWLGTKISRSIVFLPKKRVESSQNKQLTQTQKKTRYRRNYSSSVDKISSSKEEEEEEEQEEGLDNRIWRDIEDNIVKDQRDKLIENCELYLSICEKYNTHKCAEKEDVYFYLIQNTEGAQRNSFMNLYSELFPSGKYCEQVVSLLQEMEKKIVTTPPVSQGHLDYDSNAMVVDNIYGGQEPYFVGFYDVTKSKTHPIKTVRFSNRDKIIFFENLKLPEGFYAVKVFDAMGSNFTEPKRIYLDSFVKLHKSIKLVFFLAPILLLFVLYKKYITF